MIRSLTINAVLVSLISFFAHAEPGPIATEPPLGWNSFDSYGVYLHEKAAMENLEAMAKQLMPYGYEYFVIDNGWFGEYKLKSDTLYRKRPKIDPLLKFIEAVYLRGSCQNYQTTPRQTHPAPTSVSQKLISPGSPSPGLWLVSPTASSCCFVTAATSASPQN